MQLAREVLGEERDLMIDVQNRWQEVGRALSTMRAIEPYGVFFVEAPFPPDNLDAYARLADAVDTRIAVGDWGCATRFEFEEIMAAGGSTSCSPPPSAPAGSSEILRIAESGLPARAALHPPRLVPHGRRGRRDPPGRRRPQHALLRVSDRLPRFADHLGPAGAAFGAGCRRHDRGAAAAGAGLPAERGRGARRIASSRTSLVLAQTRCSGKPSDRGRA